MREITGRIEIDYAALLKSSTMKADLKGNNGLFT